MYNLPKPHRNFRPEMVTTDEYIKIVKGDKSHPSTAYDFDLGYFESGYLDYDSYPKLLKQVTIRGMQFEFRIKSTKNKFGKFNKELLQYETDENGEILYYTDEELKARGDLYEYTIAVFNHDKQAVAALQDEYGAVLIIVAQEYRGFGLGAILSRIRTTMHPDKSSGGFTSKGRHLFTKTHREIVRDALRNGTYRDEIRKGHVTLDRVKEIITSAQLDIKPSKITGINVGPTKAQHIRIFVDDFGFAFMYDMRIKDYFQKAEYQGHFLDKLVLGSVIVKENGPYARIKHFEGIDTKYKSIMMKFAIQFAVDNGLKLVIEPEDVAYIPAGNPHSEQNNEAGYQSVTVSTMNFPRIDFDLFRKHEEMWRKTFDQYDEFKSFVQELGNQR